MNTNTPIVRFHDKGKFTARVNGKNTKEYVLWNSMLTRAYNKKFLDRVGYYQGCTVSDNFKNFQYFAEWCQHQVGFKMAGYQLDKDILSDGSLHYSENNCVFVPPYINTFFLKRKASREIFQLGFLCIKVQEVKSSIDTYL